VSGASLLSIAVTPANPSIAKGLTPQFKATGTYTDTSTQDLTSQVTWSSGTASTATISSGGLASAVGVGTSTIGAKLNSITGSTVLTVMGSLPWPTRRRWSTGRLVNRKQPTISMAIVW
jgi:hypothetical protein